MDAGFLNRRPDRHNPTDLLAVSVVWPSLGAEQNVILCLSNDYDVETGSAHLRKIVYKQQVQSRVE